ncbi:MAG: hypothetical protein ACLQJR_03425 [Stellaceae bacterium]
MSVAATKNGRSRIFNLSLLLASLSMFLVATICADGFVRGLHRNFPGIYRGATSLAIAISEVRYGSANLAGYDDVAMTLEAHGIRPIPDEEDLKLLTAQPAQVDIAIDAAVHLDHVDTTKTLGLASNETGTIDYYALAFRLFGFHNASFFWLFIVLIVIVAMSFPISFWDRPVFILPSLVYLLLLYLRVHALDPHSAQYGTPSNARFMPMITLYPILYALTLSASRHRFRALDFILAGVAGLIFAFGAAMRSQSLWQIGPLGLILALWLLARVLGRPWPSWSTALARQTVWPIAAFAVAAAALTVSDQMRRDPVLYSDATAIGHPFWTTYLGATLPGFGWRVPLLEKYAGQSFGNNDDAYSGILIRKYMAEHNERIEDYLTDAMFWQPHPEGLTFWKEDKRDAVARAVTFELWRKYPASMLEAYRTAFQENLGAIYAFWIDNFWFFLMLAGLFIAWRAPLGTCRAWCMAFILVTMAPALGLATLAAVAALTLLLLLSKSDLEGFSAMIPPLATLALFVFPALCIMPVAGEAFGDYVLVAWLATITIVASVISQKGSVAVAERLRSVAIADARA